MLEILLLCCKQATPVKYPDIFKQIKMGQATVDNLFETPENLQGRN